MTRFTLHEDTICAIATPVGEAGIGIIKISGPGAFAIVRKIFRPRRQSTLALQSHRLYHGWIEDPEFGETIDEVLLSYMAAPNTYTREDVAEINCHSGYAVLSRLLELVLKSGARLAEPGEFTRRAFLNGRIDLSQAEGVIDLIRSRSDQSLRIATSHLRGALRERIQGWRESLLELHAHIEASIDFSDDMDEDPTETFPWVQRLENEVLEPITRSLEHYGATQVLREGLTLTLAGKPNVGKSSLLNALLEKDRAIVTSIPGTTRDVIEDRFLLSGVLVRILDTAGIRAGGDAIEMLGIERSLQSAKAADGVLWVIDRSRPLSEEDDLVFGAIVSTPRLVLLNKSDLPEVVSFPELEERFGRDAPMLSLSALNPANIERLRAQLSETFLKHPLAAASSTISLNLRHKECLTRALEALHRAKKLWVDGQPHELVGVELQCARALLDAILGLEADDALLDSIFSQFCLGK